MPTIAKKKPAKKRGIKMSIGLRRQRIIAMSQLMLSARDIQTVELRGRAVPGAELAIWRNNRLLPTILYLNRGKPARRPHFDHYLLQVNSDVAEADHHSLKDANWVKSKFRLFISVSVNGDSEYKEVVL